MPKSTSETLTFPASSVAVRRRRRYSFSSLVATVISTFCGVSPVSTPVARELNAPHAANVSSQSAISRVQLVA